MSGTNEYTGDVVADAEIQKLLDLSDLYDDARSACYWAYLSTEDAIESEALRVQAEGLKRHVAHLQMVALGLRLDVLCSGDNLVFDKLFA